MAREPKSLDLRRSACCLLVAALNALVLSCASPGPSDLHYVRAPIAGDPEVIESFDGNWYRLDHSGRLLTVRPGDAPWLEVAASGTTTLGEVRTEGDAIVFTVTTDRRTRVNSLAGLDGDSARLVPPGVDPKTAYCGTCNPPLKRMSWVAHKVHCLRLASKRALWSIQN